MTKIIYPITWLTGREGELADVIHEIAVEMMEHRSDLLRNASIASESDGKAFRIQASFFEEYAVVLDVIYFQLEPKRWKPEISGEMLDIARLHDIALPGWMTPGEVRSLETQED